MTMPKLHTEGAWFADERGRKVILRGVNLGGDCKVPYPDGGTNFPSDFSDHREVSFTGRPFSLNEAGEHLSRLRAGSRKVVQVSEVQGMEGETIVMQDLFKFKQTGFVNDMIQGSQLATGLRPSFMYKLISNNVKLPDSIFAR